ncbi:helix-turn-helix domain-containing protein [Dyadobacter sp. 3J3]|uniref:helix-turn-helix domain-containing protein n=1 Tax=Dyadobacter sp. 3J3 TaxID=2606600 RepID=UPI0013596E4E|nr:helix-turn-helix domain-containing protein [Dyadobacter sp. 3J3]
MTNNSKINNFYYREPWELDSVIFKGMDGRLEFYLKNQFETAKVKELNITHQEITNDLNTTREVISRLLQKMD